MKRVLIIEDDEAIAELERDYLEAAGFSVDAEYNGTVGLLRTRSGSCDLALVDLMLLELDGFAICRSIRASSEMPLVVVFGAGTDADRTL